MFRRGHGQRGWGVLLGVFWVILFGNVVGNAVCEVSRAMMFGQSLCYT